MMRKALKRQNAILTNESGQAFVEYVLMILVAISFVGIMGTGFRKGLLSVWGFYTKQISAACPGCPPNPSYRFR